MDYATIFKEQGVTDKSVKLCCEIAMNRVLISVDYAINVRIPKEEAAKYYVPQMEFESPGFLRAKWEEANEKMKLWLQRRDEKSHKTEK